MVYACTITSRYQVLPNRLHGIKPFKVDVWPRPKHTAFELIKSWSVHWESRSIPSGPNAVRYAYVSPAPSKGARTHELAVSPVLRWYSLNKASA